MDSSNDSSSTGFRTPEQQRSPVKIIDNSPRPGTQDPQDEDLSPSKHEEIEPNTKTPSPKIPSPSRRLTRLATPQLGHSPKKYGSRPTSPKADLTPPRLVKSKSQPSSPLGPQSPSKRASRTPELSPRKLSRSSSRSSSSRSQLSPSKRSPRSVTSQLHQLGLSPTKHSKKFSSLPTTPVPATSPAKTPDHRQELAAATHLPGPSTVLEVVPGPSTYPDITPKLITEKPPKLVINPVVAETVPEDVSKVLPGSSKEPEALPEETAKPIPDPATAKIIPNEETVIEITCGDKLLGIELLGGSDTSINGPAAVILDIYDKGAADDDGRLRVGDQIRECNGVVIHEEMVYLRICLTIKLPTEKVLMTVFRPDPLEYDVIETVLKRKSQLTFGINFKMAGPGRGVYISGLEDGGVAKTDGVLQIGDFLIQMGNTDVSHMSYEDIIIFTKTYREKVMKVKVKRFKIIPWEIPMEKRVKKLQL